MVEQRGGKNNRLFPWEYGHARIEHRHQHLSHPMQAQAVDNGVLGCAGHGIAHKERRELIRLVGSKELFRLSSQPQTTQPIVVVGAQKFVMFKTLDRKIRVCLGS